jgi:rubrerythrin
MHFANGMDVPSADEMRSTRLARHLIEVDLAAIAAYRAALRRLSCSGARRVLEGQLADHERHVDVLSELMASLGALPPAAGDLSSLISTGKVVFGNFAGDTGILAAMRSNEHAPLVAYETALSDTKLVPQVRALIRKHLRDEHRHAGLISVELERLPSLTLSSLCEAV